MCNMSDEEFEKLCPKGMWRSSECSNMGVPTDYLTVNGETLRCWNRKDEPYRTVYELLLEYLCENIGVSQPRNVCALAVDLAKYNNMTMGELFTKYEGEI